VTTPSNVTGYWTGSITYQPQPYATQPLVINYGTGPDANDISWVFESFKSGWDSPPVSGTVTQRASDHGGWATAQFYAPRVLTMIVDALCPNQATRDLARALMQQIVPVNDLALFQHDEPIPKIFFARRSGQIVETLPNQTDAVFNIPLVAPDPRKYGATLRNPAIATIVPEGFFTIGSKTTGNSSIGSGVTLPTGVTPATQTATNYGTFETRPTIQITGPIIGPGLRNNLTGQAVTWTATTMGPGDVLNVNFDSRTSYLDGNFYPADITSSWWTLWPGPNVIQLFGSPGSSGGASMQILYRDAYI
jgi:Phage tail protein